MVVVRQQERGLLFSAKCDHTSVERSLLTLQVCVKEMACFASIRDLKMFKCQMPCLAFDAMFAPSMHSNALFP